MRTLTAHALLEHSGIILDVASCCANLHYTDESQKAETVPSVVTYIYIGTLYIYIDALH